MGLSCRANSRNQLFLSMVMNLLIIDHFLQVSSEFYKKGPSEEKIPAKDLTGKTDCKTEVDK